MAKIITGKQDHGYIGRIERGEQTPSIEYIEKLLEVYEKSEAQFFSDVELEYFPQKPPPK